MKKFICILFFIQIFVSQLTTAQTESLKIYKGFNDSPREKNGVRIVFYNVENLFDIFDDSLKRYGEFTPEGAKFWNNYKYYDKLNKISKTLISVGGWEAPGIIGFCEVENYFVLKQLTEKTSLKKFHYKIIHYDSPDGRGIDNGLIYRPEKFKPLYSKPIKVSNSTLKTRDILYVKGLVLNKDTLHLFINHWPSRWGGQAKSEPKRIYVASVLRSIADSLLENNPKANIVIVGDLNDEPSDKSVIETLKAGDITENLQSNSLYNLMYEKQKNGEGSLVYKDFTGYHWNMFDQFIVSAELLKPKKGLIISSDKAQIFKAEYLLEKTKDGFIKPFRTYAGPRFLGGYSDHLPVFIDLIFNK